MIRFSIITVCLNPGKELKRTIESIKSQDYKEYEIILKDGFSTDGSVDEFLNDESITLIQKKDTGIYDAMNQAIPEATGDYVIFLNCGDYFYDGSVLSKASEFIEKCKDPHHIYYGDIFDRARGNIVSSSPVITPFVCFRNVPCHQACFYSKDILKKRIYDIKYRVRADYDHFLGCYFEDNADPKDMGMIVASYEGGGYSETPKGLEISKREREEIIRKYLSGGQIFKYNLIMGLTLMPLRKKISESPVFSGMYQKLKSAIYRK